MMEKLLEVLVGQLPEAIYFALFLLFTKEIKTKRVLFIIISCVEYLLAFNVFRYTLWSHMSYFFMMYLALKMLYKNKAQIIDVFTLGIASISLIIINVLSYLILSIFHTNYIVYAILNRVVMFIVIFILRNKLPNINKLYIKLWNRNDNVPKKMKSTTFRALNTVVFNTMFFIINTGMFLALVIFGR